MGRWIEGKLNERDKQGQPLTTLALLLDDPTPRDQPKAVNAARYRSIGDLVGQKL